MSENQAVGIILAAGKGVRMKSDLPKALQKVAGVPMIRLIVEAMKAGGVGRVVIVVGHKGEAIQSELGSEVEYAWQKDQLGTGHAVTVTKDLLVGFDGSVVIAPGDAPLLDASLFEFALNARSGAACTLATAIISDPTGYGRIVRGAKGELLRIVEEKDATDEIRAIKEVNAGIYCFDSKALYESLPMLRNSNAQREYYLTDLVEIMAQKGLAVRASVFPQSEILVGVNDKWQLALAEKEFQQRSLKMHALAGVTILDIDSVYLGPHVHLGVGVTIEPGTVILGKTEIGRGSTIGPNTRIEDCIIGENCRVYMSHLQGAHLGAGVKCGPFANVRPDTVLEDRVKVGNFVEIKKSILRSEVSVGHLAYLGDAEVGERTNIGAGTITCNYNGKSKSKTEIGMDVFVGSNSTLIAPLKIGDGAMIAGGSTITNDLPADAGAFGRARQETKEGWALKWRKRLGSGR
jgi:bifunctional UDP-N-acetylglucosamine pyrophosphorylase/glucosamine-1-phosphate N-acetyltransferase